MRRALLVLLCAGCIGTTGGDVVDFPVAAAGPALAVAGTPYAFVTDRGWNVTLTQATLHVGALYLSENAPISGAQTTGCILPGTYVAQVTTGMDVDLLSGTPQRFAVLGHGTTLPSVTGQVWLTGGPIDTSSDSTPILVIAGTADRNGEQRPFTGRITISDNRLSGSTTGNAGSNTICKQRIVTPIATPGVAVLHGGGLMLRIDPRYLFTNVDFTSLDGSFSDDPTSADYTQPSANLYQNLHAAGGLYAFGWDPSL